MMKHENVQEHKLSVSAGMHHASVGKCRESGTLLQGSCA
jgi:hypothetical protein